jgi:ribosomal protein L7Ae-like RNA K-turn-binding protein
MIGTKEVKYAIFNSKSLLTQWMGIRKIRGNKLDDHN